MFPHESKRVTPQHQPEDGNLCFGQVCGQSFPSENGVAEHYLELVTGPPPPTTRTRARSERGEPPEWFKGAHGEAVRASQSTLDKLRTDDIAKVRQAFKKRREKRKVEGAKKAECDVFADVCESVDPLVASTADAVATSLGFIADGACTLKLDSESHTRAAVELLEMCREADIDSLEVVMQLERLLLVAGQSPDDVGLLIQTLQLHLYSVIYEEYGGSGNELHFLLDICDDVKKHVTRSEGIADRFMLHTQTGAYHSLCRDIEAVEDVPEGVRTECSSLVASMAEFQTNLTRFSMLAKGGRHYERKAALQAHSQERVQGEADLMALNVKRLCIDHEKKHESWKQRLMQKYVAFAGAHKKIQEEIEHFAQKYDETDAENKKNEAILEEWTRKLQTLIEQKERRAGDTNRAERRRRELEQQYRKELRMYEIQRDFLQDEIEQHEAYIQQYTTELDIELVLVCANEWLQKLEHAHQDLLQHREAIAFEVEEKRVRVMIMHEKLDLKKLQDADSQLQDALRWQCREYAGLLQQVQDMDRVKLISLRRLQDAEQWLQHHGQNWRADHSSGVLIAQPPLNTPLSVLLAYRDWVKRRARMKKQKASILSQVTKAAEAPARPLPSMAELVWDSRYAAKGSSKESGWSQCVVNSMSASSLVPDRNLIRLPRTLPIKLSDVLDVKDDNEKDWLGQRRLLKNKPEQKQKIDLRADLGLDDLQPYTRTVSKNTERPDLRHAITSPLESMLGGSGSTSLKSNSLDIPMSPPSLPRSPSKKLFKSLHLASDKSGVADWSRILRRWAALWSEVQRLGDSNLDLPVDFSSSTKKRSPLWRPQTLARLHSIILDGGRHSACLEKLEKALNNAYLAYSTHFLAEPEGVDPSIATDLHAALETHWRDLESGVLTQKRRQCATADIIAILKKLEARFLSIFPRLQALGDYVQDMAVTSRLLRAKDKDRAADDARELRKSTRDARFHAECIAADARQVFEEFDALFGAHGPVTHLEVSPLYVESVSKQPQRVAELISSSLSMVKLEIQVQMGVLEAAEASERREAAEVAERQRQEAEERLRQRELKAAKAAEAAVEAAAQESQDAAAKKCPQGHLLQSTTVGLEGTEHTRHNCDGCGTQINKTAQIYRCAECDYDLCVKCYKARRESFDSSSDTASEAEQPDRKRPTAARRSISFQKDDYHPSKMRPALQGVTRPRGRGRVKRAGTRDDTLSAMPHLNKVFAEAQSWLAKPDVYGPGKKDSSKLLKSLMSRAAKRKKKDLQVSPVGSETEEVRKQSPAKVDVTKSCPEQESERSRVTSTVAKHTWGRARTTPLGVGGSSSQSSRTPSPNVRWNAAASAIRSAAAFKVAKERKTDDTDSLANDLDEETPMGREDNFKRQTSEDCRSVGTEQSLRHIEPQLNEELLEERFSRPTSPGITLSTKSLPTKHNVSIDRLPLPESSPFNRMTTADSSASDCFGDAQEERINTDFLNAHFADNDVVLDAPVEDRVPTEVTEDAKVGLISQTVVPAGCPERTLFQTHLATLQGSWDVEQSLEELQVGLKGHAFRETTIDYVADRPIGHRRGSQDHRRRTTVAQLRLTERRLSQRMTSPDNMAGFASSDAVEQPTDEVKPAFELQKPRGWKHTDDSNTENGRADSDDMLQIEDEELHSNPPEFVDVDVPLDSMLTRPETPAWIQDMLERVVALPQPLQTGPVSDLDDVTPPPPAVAAPQSVLSHVTASDSPRSSRHMWLPLQGVDANKVCWRSLPSDLVSRLTPERNSRSPSPERSNLPVAGDSRARARRDAIVTPSPRHSSRRPSLPPRPHTVEPGAVSAGPVPRKTPGWSRPSTSQAVYRQMKVRPPSSQSTSGANDEPVRPPSAKVQPPSAKLPELDKLSWLPSSFSEPQPNSGSGTAPAASVRGDRSGSENRSSTIAEVPFQGCSAASAPKKSVLARGFLEQVQNGVAVCAARQRTNTPEVCKTPTSKAPWTGRSGPLGRAVAARPRRDVMCPTR